MNVFGHQRVAVTFSAYASPGIEVLFYLELHNIKYFILEK